MKTLYIDTSSSYLYAGIVVSNKLIQEVQKNYGQELSQMAIVDIFSMFEKSKIDPKEIDKIIVVNGPGSFTGIRIGITIAKVYAWALKKEITTITSLEAMAISSKSRCVHVPMLDARRGYVYTAIYDENNQEVEHPQYVKLSEFKKRLMDISNYQVITNDDIDLDASIEKYAPDILKIVTHFQDKEGLNPHGVNPDYLKQTEAEESRK